MVVALSKMPPTRRALVGKAFEEVVVESLRRHHGRHATVLPTQQSRDFGLDGIIVDASNRRFFGVQAKFLRSSNVSAEDVLKTLGAMTYYASSGSYSAGGCYIVTSGGFTGPAEKIRSSLPGYVFFYDEAKTMRLVDHGFGCGQVCRCP